MSIYDIALCVLSLATCIRLLFYRRGRAKYKALYSLLAYVLIVATGSVGLAVLTGLIQALQLSLWLWLLQAAVAVAIFLCRGNVSHLIKLSGRLHHVINFR